MDVTPAFVAAARSRAARLARVHAEFLPADITAPGWTEPLRTRAPFDVALAAAVLHHIPAFELRCAVLSAIRTLLRPGGMLVLSSWQFQNDPRLEQKVVPWQRVDIDAGELEAGDTLIDWKRGGEGYRYCHLLSPAEIEQLAGLAGYEVVAQSTDGSSAAAAGAGRARVSGRKPRPGGRALDLWSTLQAK